MSAPFRDKILNAASSLDPNQDLVSPRDYESSVFYQFAADPHGGNRAALSSSSLERIKEWILGL